MSGARRIRNKSERPSRSNGRSVIYASRIIASTGEGNGHSTASFVPGEFPWTRFPRSLRAVRSRTAPEKNRFVSTFRCSFATKDPGWDSALRMIRDASFLDYHRARSAQSVFRYTQETGVDHRLSLMYQINESVQRRGNIPAEIDLFILSFPPLIYM